MKIIVRQLSGLGNQMFQYAAGFYYAKEYAASMEIAVDPPHLAVSYGSPRPFLLSHFAITASHRGLTRIERLMLLSEHPRIKPTFGALLQHALLQFGPRVQLVAESPEQRFHYQSSLPVSERARTVYLLGYWQVANIAEKLGADLRKEFSFREKPVGKNLEALRLISNTDNSVSLHIRRGDYTLEAEGNVALAMGYYAKAISFIKERLENPTFFIFSDDIEFARKNIGNDVAAVFIDHNDSYSAHEDMRLMSTCRHHIIANSTFSWWGAWLGTHQNKIVLAPREWMVGNCPLNNDIFPPTWHLMAASA